MWTWGCQDKSIFEDCVVDITKVKMQLDEYLRYKKNM